MMDAAALQHENNLLREQLIAEQEKLALEKEKLVERDTQITVLQEQLKSLLQKRYGASSEKSSPDQLGLFNEAEEILAEEEQEHTDAAATTTVNSHTRCRKPRVSIPDHLPREDIIHDLPEAEKVCPHDGSALTHVGSEDHEQLDIIPAKVKVIRHKRLKYACPCCERYIVTADKPKQPIEKSIASPQCCSLKHLR